MATYALKTNFEGVTNLDLVSHEVEVLKDRVKAGVVASESVASWDAAKVDVVLWGLPGVVSVEVHVTT